MAKGGGGSFATFLILCPTSFFLGILFSAFPYDYPLLWTSSLPPATFYTNLETHLKFLHASPAIIPRLLHIMIFLGLLGFIIKLYKPSESNVLFDGASLVLYMIAVIVYITNIVKGLRIVTEGTYGDEVVGGEASLGVGVGEDVVVGRVESLRVLAASNTILALVLVGVLVLQAGQWYAERKEADEMEKMMEEEAEGAKAGPTGGKNARRSPSIKKKQ
ncbi:MAG: hypothetical protein M1839_002484 [Geoglossum umbratile]|nr:MAG: hypothetical protein M1839_002484 [Geoglossum umbratile]